MSVDLLKSVETENGNDSKQHNDSKQPSPGTPNISWDTVAKPALKGSKQLMQCLASLLNTKLDAMENFEQRKRFTTADIANVYLALVDLITPQVLNKQD